MENPGHRIREQVRAGFVAKRKSKMPPLKFFLLGERTGVGWTQAVEVNGERGVCMGLGPAQAGPASKALCCFYNPQRQLEHQEARDGRCVIEINHFTV